MRVCLPCSDGRAFTSYLSNCEYEAGLMRQFSTQGETHYRAVLQHNASAADKAAKNRVTALTYHGVHGCPTSKR